MKHEVVLLYIPKLQSLLSIIHLASVKSSLCTMITVFSLIPYAVLDFIRDTENLEWWFHLTVSKLQGNDLILIPAQLAAIA